MILVNLVPTLMTIWQVVISDLSPETQTKLGHMGLERRTFWELVAALFALAIITVSVEGAFSVIRKREQAEERVRHLALIILRGRQLQDRCANVQANLPTEDLEAWTMDVGRLLDCLGGNYSGEFTNPLNRPKPITVIETLGGIQKSIPSRLHYDQWKLLGYRIERLEEYLAKLSSD